MNRRLTVTVAFALLALAGIAFVTWNASGDSVPAFQTEEYAVIRWAGRENTYLIRPNGQVESLRPLMMQVKRPERTDERTYLMTIAMNAVAKEGYEFAALSGDEVVMRRRITK